MMSDDFGVIRGSGNLYRDLGYADADVRQTKAVLAAKIIGVLDDNSLSTRQAEACTGISHSEFVRIRRANFERFTIDRLMTILNRLGQQVEVDVTVRPRTRIEERAEDAARP